MEVGGRPASLAGKAVMDFPGTGTQLLLDKPPSPRLCFAVCDSLADCLVFRREQGIQLLPMMPGERFMHNSF